MMNRLAEAIVRRYPPPWRERYEAEVLSLIDDSPVRVTDLGELARGLVRERVRALIEDADHPQRAIALMSAVPFAFVVLFVASAWGTGLALRSWREFPQPLEDFGTLVLLGWLFLFELIRWYLRRQQKLSFWMSEQIRVPGRLGVGMLAGLFAVIVVVEWCGGAFGVSSQHANHEFFQSFWILMRVHIYTRCAATLTSSFWPQHRMLTAFGQLTTAEAGLKEAQIWADGCRTWLAASDVALTDGTPRQLQEAQARLERWGAERAAALEQLQSLGYRASFERPA